MTTTDAVREGPFNFAAHWHAELERDLTKKLDVCIASLEAIVSHGTYRDGFGHMIEALDACLAALAAVEVPNA